MLPSFYSAVEQDFRSVDDLIRRRLASRVPLVEEIATYLVSAGGKRLRPLLVLLSSRALGYREDRHLALAAIIEFLHTAMLLHDDVVDASTLRRGRATVNATWGNAASVLVGDFLHSRAFEMMVEIGDLRVMDILAGATNTIAQGEVQQLANVRNANLAEDEYMQVIDSKTARLFEAAAHSGAVLATPRVEAQEAMRAYGRHLGLAFQLIDDALDYDGSSDALGKNVGDDLAEGKVTLPLIHAMRTGTAAQSQLIRNAVARGGLDNLDAILDAVQSTGAIEYTHQRAEEQRRKAQACLVQIEDSSYRQAMYNLADFAVRRDH